MKIRKLLKRRIELSRKRKDNIPYYTINIGYLRNRGLSLQSRFGIRLLKTQE